MSLFVQIAPLAGALAIQTPSLADPSTRDAYSRPVVAPYQTPSDFGRETAEGDGDSAAFRARLTRAVSVDDYRRSYEFSPSAAEAAYDQGVAQAEIDADAAAGSLDGRWALVDETGRILASLAVSGAPLSGAVGGWMEGGGAWANVRRTGAVNLLERRDGAATIDLVGEGRVTLSRAADGTWIGVLADSEGARPVILKRRA